VSAPLVSVLTPSFNQARWLRECLSSVAMQTHPRLEHIVVDGGSTDDSVELLRASKARWTSEKDRGQSHALNKAFAQAQGDVVGWVNADDAYWDGGAVAAAVAELERRPEVDVLYGHAAIVNAGGLILQFLWTPAFGENLLKRVNFIPQPTVFFRRRALEKGFLDESYHSAMDRELWLRLARDGRRFARLDRVLAIDRHHPARKSVAQPEVQRADLARLRSEYGATRGRLRPVYNTLFRIAGVGLIQLADAPLAFDAKRDARWRLLLRQLVVPRSRMPM
jgi:glycosyltransferase involved in cell wall biosynthesis